jgi:hypothetical protein
LRLVSSVLTYRSRPTRAYSTPATCGRFSVDVVDSMPNQFSAIADSTASRRLGVRAVMSMGFFLS